MTTTRRFIPPAASHEAVRAAEGQVEVVELVQEEVRTDQGTFPLYRVRNIVNGREAFAFGDELSTGVTDV